VRPGWLVWLGLGWLGLAEPGRPVRVERIRTIVGGVAGFGFRDVHWHHDPLPRPER
jgi:hypothetical protein